MSNWQPPKPPPPGEPIRISWSKIRVFEECKQRSYLQRTGRRHGAKDVRGFFRGTVVDRVMRQWLEQPDPPLGAMPGMVRGILDVEEADAASSGDGIVKWKNAVDREETVDWCVRLVTNLEPILEELILPYDYEPAKKFEVPVKIPWIDGETPTYVILNGEMDLLARDAEGRYMCWDLKGTENNQYWKKVLGQLVFYDIATAAMFGQYCKLTGLIQPLASPMVMPFEFGLQDYQSMWQRIIAFANAVWTEDNEPNEDNTLCTWCDEKHACAKFQPVQKSGHRVMLGLQIPTRSEVAASE